MISLNSSVFFSGHGCLSEMSGGIEDDDDRCPSFQRLCRRLGRMQPFVPSMLHESMDQTEQPMSPLSARVDGPKAGKVGSRHREKKPPIDDSFFLEEPSEHHFFVPVPINMHALITPGQERS